MRIGKFSCHFVPSSLQTYLSIAFGLIFEVFFTTVQLEIYSLHIPTNSQPNLSFNLGKEAISRQFLLVFNMQSISPVLIA